jgi:very-short-patch-repair endonuclease
MGMLIFLAVLLIVIAVIFEILQLRKSSGNTNESVYKYRRKDFLISRAEHEFFDILVELIGDQYYVFPQIHLPTILDNKVVGQNWKGAFRHIDEKSVDFVICDKAHIKPLLAIELDDRTHERENRKERDEEVELILRESGLPLLRFGNNGHFDKEEIKRLIQEKIK